MDDKITLVEAIAIMVEHYDTYTKRLGMPLIKAFVNADAIKIRFESIADSCTVEAYYKEELKGSFTTAFYDLTDYISAILKDVISEHIDNSLEEALEECLLDYSLDGFMDLLTQEEVSIEIENENIISFKFEDINTCDKVSIIIPADPDYILRSSIMSAIHTC